MYISDTINSVQLCWGLFEISDGRSWTFQLSKLLVQSSGKDDEEFNFYYYASELFRKAASREFYCGKLGNLYEYLENFYVVSVCTSCNGRNVISHITQTKII